MLTSSVFLTVDPSSFGRFDRSTLSDQTLMELFFSLSTSFPTFMKDSDGDFTDFNKWPNLESDKNGDSFTWCINYRYSSIMQLDWQWVPSNVRDLTLLCPTLEGTLPTHLLPNALEKLAVYGTKMAGTIDFRSFPSHMKSINFNRTDFEGTVDFRSLPQALRELRIRRNKFSGIVSMLHLPNPLLLVDIRDNMFEGDLVLSKALIWEHYFSYVPILGAISISGNKITSIDVRSIPIEAKGIVADNNRLSGSFRLCDVPRHVLAIKIGKNNFSGSLFLTDLPKPAEFFDANTNFFSGNIDLAELPHRVMTLDLAHNSLTGSVLLNREVLPKGIRLINLSANKMTGSINLLKLPRVLIRLDLSNNSLQQSTLQCGGFTKDLQRIDLRGNEIGEVQWRSHRMYKNKLMKD